MKTTMPIKKKSDIKIIKNYFNSNKMHKLFFVLAINTGLRAGDLLKLKVKDLNGLKVGDGHQFVEEKTGKNNILVMNNEILKAFTEYLTAVKPEDEYFIFHGRKGDPGQQHVKVSSMSRIFNGVFKELKFNASIGLHGLRKTWGYFQRVHFGTDIILITERYKHSSYEITKRYIGITEDEVKNICLNEI